MAPLFLLTGSVFAVEADLVFKLAAGEEIIDVFQSRLGNVLDGLAGKESLVRGDDHVIEGQEARQDIICQHPVREILEEELALLLVYVKSCRPDLSGLEPLYQV